MPRPLAKPKPSVAITASGGYWQAFPRIGTKPDGNVDRVKRSAKMCASCREAPNEACACWDRCADKVREIDAKVAGKEAVTKGRPETLAVYLDGWLEDIRDRLEYKTWVSYRDCVRRLRASTIAGTAVPELDPRDITKVLKRIGQDVSPNEAHKVWRTLRSAMSEYERLHPTSGFRNPAKLARPPVVVEKPVKPFTVDEARRIFAEIEARGPRQRARWLTAIYAGLRQGEALALSESRDDPDIPPDLVGDVLSIREKQYRRTWEHGCDDPHACGERLHKASPCPPGCARHARACPPPCAPTCVAHASACPTRHGGGLVTGTPKSKRERVQVLPPRIVAIVDEWRAERAAWRQRAGSKWVESGRLFVQPLGQPIDARRDWGELQEILHAAGVAERGSHATRHTAASFMRLLKIDRRVVMEALGWSTEAMAVRYESVDLELLRDAARRMDELLAPIVQDPEPVGPNSATAAATAGGAKILQFRRRAV